MRDLLGACLQDYITSHAKSYSHYQCNHKCNENVRSNKQQQV